MKKILLTSFFLICAIAPPCNAEEYICNNNVICPSYEDSYSSEEIYIRYAFGIIQNELFRTKYSNIPITGLVKGFYKNRNLMFEVNVKEGKLDGISKFYNEKGEIEREVFYNSGEKNGATKFYDESGHLKNGVFKLFYDNGQCGFEGFYVDGELKSEKRYYRKGYLKSEKENGVQREYYEDGKLKSEKNYQEGKKHGIQREYFNGLRGHHLEREENYKNGKKEGTQKSYRENGELMLEITYVDGIADGKLKQYWNGKLQYECFYRKGEREKCKLYTSDGELYKEFK